MRSYVNKSGERVTVTEEHLKTAVRIKKELQKASPSRKASMKQLVDMMEKEGFYDADNNESYRCMLKSYQKPIGELPEATKHADMVAEGKLESIKELVGEIAVEKRSNQNVLRELNKVKRDVIDFTLIAEEIGKAIKEHDWSDLQLTYEELYEGDKAMIVCLSDLHIGAVVNSDINTYNYEVAKERLNTYMNKVILEILNNRISEVYLINLGDSIENPYMHNLSFSCEFTLSEQLVKASDLIIKFMIELSKYANVTVAGIGGNHDRLHENKNVGLDGDHAVKAINSIIKTFIENSNIERITYEQAKDYDHTLLINGIHVKFVHGDLDGINDRNLIAKHSYLDSTDYTLLVMGHFHHHHVKEEGMYGTVVGFGSLKGADSHGQKNRRISSPSQGYIIVDEFGNYEIRSVKL